MDQPAHVPQLGDDLPPAAWTALGHRLPALDLGLGPQARRIRPAEAFAADAGRFGDDQAGAGALGIIFGHDRRRHRLLGGAAAGQRRHPDAVLEAQRTDGGRDRTGWALQFFLLSRRLPSSKELRQMFRIAKPIQAPIALRLSGAAARQCSRWRSGRGWCGWPTLGPVAAGFWRLALAVPFLWRVARVPASRCTGRARGWRSRWLAPRSSSPPTLPPGTPASC